MLYFRFVCGVKEIIYLWLRPNLTVTKISSNVCSNHIVIGDVIAQKTHQKTLQKKKCQNITSKEKKPKTLKKKCQKYFKRKKAKNTSKEKSQKHFKTKKPKTLQK